MQRQASDVRPAWYVLAHRARASVPPRAVMWGVVAVGVVALLGCVIVALFVVAARNSGADAATGACGTLCGAALCSPAGTCVQCLEDGDCGVAQVCRGNACAHSCVNASTCPSATPLCVGGACTTCATNADCSAAAPWCTAAGACVVCRYASVGAGYGCSQTETCLPNGTCASLCTGACAAPLVCVTAPGGGAFVCAACGSDTDCTGSTPYCMNAGVPSHAVCAACRVSDDCPVGEGCSDGTCSSLTCSGAPLVSNSAFLITDSTGTHCATATMPADSDVGAVLWLQCAVDNAAQLWTLVNIPSAQSGSVGLANGAGQELGYQVWLGTPTTATNPAPVLAVKGSSSHILGALIQQPDGFIVHGASGVTALTLYTDSSDNSLVWNSSVQGTSFRAVFLESPACA